MEVEDSQMPQIRRPRPAAYAWRRLRLEAKLWLAESTLGRLERAAGRAASGPRVLDALREREARELRAERLRARRDDLAQALDALESSRSPFFGF